jgi:AcrR family transcriptional regulator
MSKDEILSAAAQIFREKGFHAASMSDIAQTVNLQKASLYHHISSKQEILLALLDRGIDLLIDQVGQVGKSDASPELKIAQAIKIYLQILTDHRDLASVLLFEHRSLEPDFQKRHIPRRDDFERLWKEMLQEGFEAGVFSCPDPSLAAKYLLGVLNWMITWYRPGGKLSANEIADQFSALFLKGILSGRYDSIEQSIAD